MTDKFIATLRRHKHSLTPLRLGVFAYLDKRGPIPTAQLVSDNLTLGDRASLYRALALFRRLGIIEDVVMAGHRLIELTDGYDRHHHHLTCLRCGRSITITSPDIETLISSTAAQHGFQAQSHHIEISGLCSHCSSQNQ
jgi:Fur family ferric uptake transcriptional regulator